VPSLYQIYGFCVSKEFEFSLVHGERKRQLGRNGVRVLTLLACVFEHQPAAADPAWLLSWRAELRAIARSRSREALTLVVDRAPDVRLRRLAIWLRGRCGGTLGTAIVARSSASPDCRTRKEAAHCLRRMSAWSELRRMAESDPDPRIRRIATQQPPKTFSRRLAAVSQFARQHDIETGQRPLVESAELNLSGRPARRSWLIRLVLERIHQLVMECQPSRKRRP
jgi:hypothetical protein